MNQAPPPVAAFRAVLEAGGPSFMPTQILVVPEAAWQAVGGKATKRVVATLNGHPERLGLLPLAGGGRYLMLRKDLCEHLGLAIGQEVEVHLVPDPDPDHVDLPAELAEALGAWPEAEAAFARQSGAMRRAIARKVADAKRPETRARYAVELTERLARGSHPFRA
ncbi:YdeI/OmpD-associated family protein [Hymenobacter bucti]|uniref:YdeI/OmpD-associated family protein n=1 Tax=Hymenobacter bucti TaxID=1844114 RepID=A0ABW4QW54_9BACT